MKILVHDYAGHPFQVQLSRSLARRGHQVLHLYAGYNTTPHGQLKSLKDDTSYLNIDSIFIRQPLQKFSLVKRWFQANEYGRLLAARIDQYHPDIVISGNTPLNSQSFALKKCIKKKIRFLFWLQDMEGIATHRILKKRIPLLGALAGRFYISLEKDLLRKSDYIIAITEDFVSYLIGYGITRQKIVVIENWATLEDLKICSKINPWSQYHGITEKFVFLYTGSMGMKHNPEILLQLAIHFKENPNVIVLIISEGLGAIWLEQQKREYGLNNIQILCYQPVEQMANLLASGDVLLAILEPDAGVFSVPSKVLSYLCAQRPILLSVPLSNLAARIVTDNQAGVAVPPGNIKMFLNAAEELLKNPILRETFGTNARSYAECHFDIETITDTFLNLMKS